MRTAFAAAIAAIACLAGSPAPAADRLTPGADLVDGYLHAVSGVLRSAFEDVETQAIVLPSFAPEYAVGTKQHDGFYFVFFSRAKSQVWPALLNKKPTAGIGEDRCEIPVSSDLGKRIASVWDGMLRRIAAGAPPATGVDGEEYYFAATVDGTVKIGMTWSPTPDTEPGQLAAIADTMADLCTQRTNAIAARLSTQVDVLLAQLKADGS